MALNDNQRRSLGVELQHLERSVRDLLQKMKQPQSGILYARAALPPEERERPEPVLQRILEEISVVAERFGLDRREDNIRGILQAGLSGAWEGLYDSLSAKLGRFGDVDPELEWTLDPHVRRLIALTDQIIRDTSGPPR